MLESIKFFSTLFAVIPLVLIIGIALSIQLKWPQIKLMPTSWRVLKKAVQKSSNASQSTYSAIAAVLGGNLGTGNIAGMAMALSMGGPGAIFWMWVMAFLASIFKFAECYLSVKYVQSKNDPSITNGPMGYMRSLTPTRFPLLGHRLSILYGISLLIAAYGVGNFVQVQSLALPLESHGIPRWLVGIFMATLVTGVLSGGLKRFNNWVTKIVPLMALFYISISIFVLIQNIHALPLAIKSILSHAFQLKPIGSGLFSYGLLRSMQVGFDRGLFATDAGSGLAGVLHGHVKDQYDSYSKAKSQAIASLISPFIVMIICLLTALVLIVSQIDTTLYESTNMCVAAFNQSIKGSGHVVTLTLFFFSFTTILTWSICAESVIQQFFQWKTLPPFFYKWSEKKWIILSRAIFISCIPLGAMANVDMIWQVSDLAMNSMLICNIVAMVFLRRELREHKKDGS